MRSKRAILSFRRVPATIAFPLLPAESETALSAGDGEREETEDGATPLLACKAAIRSLSVVLIRMRRSASGERNRNVSEADIWQNALTKRRQRGSPRSVSTHVTLQPDHFRIFTSLAESLNQYRYTRLWALDRYHMKLMMVV